MLILSVVAPQLLDEHLKLEWLRSGLFVDVSLSRGNSKLRHEIGFKNMDGTKGIKCVYMLSFLFVILTSSLMPCSFSMTSNHICAQETQIA